MAMFESSRWCLNRFIKREKEGGRRPMVTLADAIINRHQVLIVFDNRHHHGSLSGETNHNCPPTLAGESNWNDDDDVDDQDFRFVVIFIVIVVVHITNNWNWQWNYKMKYIKNNTIIGIYHILFIWGFVPLYNNWLEININSMYRIRTRYKFPVLFIYLMMMIESKFLMINNK